MLPRTTLTSLLLLAGSLSVNGFAFWAGSTKSTTTATTTATSTQLRMGLFDGVKEAFSAPASQIDSERETPIDRWMGWSVASDNSSGDSTSTSTTAPVDFVDSMDEKNYVTADLSKPMGIVFEENDADYGGIFVHSLKEGGVAAQDGSVREGDQLVAVQTSKVSGLAFDDALGTIIDAEGSTVKLTFFRGTAEQLYGPTGASQAWLDEFIGAPKEEKAKAE